VTKSGFCKSSITSVPLPICLSAFNQPPIQAMNINPTNIANLTSLGDIELLDEYEVVVVGAGHSGCEAALASARMGRKLCC
jgi:tRNA A37 threonylcarbamoyladenosine dehydratase